MVGCDGGRSRVREAIDVEVSFDPAAQAWAVMDILADTDFPDFRSRGGIQSHQDGSILLIPREGGLLTRFYVSLDSPDDENRARLFATTAEEAIERAKRILHPYSLEVKDVAWFSIYEVRHTVAQSFDNVSANPDDERDPRVFIGGDACHTHSAKAGQGMNVSIQDGWNIAWKLGQVLEGRSDPSLLSTYHDERQNVAQQLIEYDQQWSAMMSKRPEEMTSPREIVDFFSSTASFTSGFGAFYKPSRIIGTDEHQGLAKGFPIGIRMKSARVARVADALPMHLGHHFRADGRWRLYAFADTDAGKVTELAEWLENSEDSPVRLFTPAGADIDSVFDAKVIYQQGRRDFEMADVHRFFRPKVGPHHIPDYEKLYATLPDEDIFDLFGIDRDGALIIQRPDMYVAHVLPLTARKEITDFLAQSLLPQNGA